jgi:RimJ/RimL family protein N-acetyltransferase
MTKTDTCLGPNLGPTLTTDRLILRAPSAADFPAYAEFMADAEHVRFIGGAVPAATAWRQWTSIAGAWALHGYSMFSVTERSTGKWLGRIGPWQPHGWPGKEVAWGLSRAATGQGYGVEAATACLDYVFDVLRWEEVIHVIDPDNAPSIALAQRLGSRKLGATRLPEPYLALVVDAWGQSRQQWLDRRRAGERSEPGGGTSGAEP